MRDLTTNHSPPFAKYCDCPSPGCDVFCRLGAGLCPPNMPVIPGLPDPDRELSPRTVRDAVWLPLYAWPVLVLWRLSRMLVVL